MLGAATAAAQSGDVTGRVREAVGRGFGVGEARVTVAGTLYTAVTDFKGRYRIHGIPVGRYVVRVDAGGYRSSLSDSVLVLSGGETGQDFRLARDTTVAAPAPLPDPRLRDTRQRLDDPRLDALPVSSVAEAAGLWNAVSDDSYRGGRPGEQATRIDGLELRDWYDGSTRPAALRVPLGFVEQMSLITDGAHLDGSPAGVLDINTASGPATWRAATRYETDRPLAGAGDLGLDRAVLQAGGPAFGGGRVLALFDVTGRLQTDPHDAPVGAAGTPLPWAFPHNNGETLDGATKLTLPVGRRSTVNVLFVSSLAQQLIFDPSYKYDPESGSARRSTATLVATHWRHVAGSISHPLIADVRLAFVAQAATEGALREPVSPQLGALTASAYHFWGEGIAHALDTAAARSAVTGYLPPAYSVNTPWGVPAFFLTGSRGDLLWDRTRELRAQVAVSATPSPRLDVTTDVGLSLRHVDAFQRVLAYLPVGDSVPPATALAASPAAFNGGVVVETRARNSVVTVGVRVDGTAPGGGRGLHVGFSPRLGFTLSLDAVTLTSSVARVSEFPDAQFMADVAFDDTTAAGHFRRGAASLTDEHALLGDVGMSMRLAHGGTLRASGFIRHFSNLVGAAAVTGNPDSSVLVNGDDGDVSGAELRWDQRIRGVALAAAFTVQATQFQSSYGLQRSADAAPLDQDRPRRLALSVRAPLPMALDLGAFLRFDAGRPFSEVDPTGQLVGGAPNAGRLPSWFSVDARVQRHLHAAGIDGRVVLDVRNILNRRNVIAVRRDVGTPGLSPAQIDSAAQAAYAVHPDPIPYDSPAYRAAADLDGNGLIEGSTELLPLYEAAARDYATTPTAFGAPRLVRLGLELIF